MAKNKFDRLYEAVLNEFAYPPGIDEDDIQDVPQTDEGDVEPQDVDDVEDEDGGEDEESGDELTEAHIEDADVTDADLDKIAASKAAGETDLRKGVEKMRSKSYRKPKGEPKVAPAKSLQRLIHNNSMLEVLDDTGTKIDVEKFKAVVTVPPKKIISANEKLEISGKAISAKFYDLTLPAYQGLFYDERAGKVRMVRTCPKAQACTGFCYACKGGYIQYPASWVNSARTLNLLMNHYDVFKSRVLEEIAKAVEELKEEGKTMVLRWHDAGDIFCKTYKDIIFEIANETPEVLHYAYTKMVSMIQSSDIPENFEFVFSQGGEEDMLIDRGLMKHSVVVYKRYFDDLFIYKEPPETFLSTTDKDYDSVLAAAKGKEAKAFKERLKKEMSDETAAKAMDAAVAKMIKENPRLSKLEAQCYYLDKVDMGVLKDRMASQEVFGIPRDSIITYDELNAIGKPAPGPTRKYNVVIRKGDGDDAAARKDVLGVYLLEH